MSDDTISRKATIDAMENVDWYHINKDGQLVHGANSKEDEPLYKAKDVITHIHIVVEEKPDQPYRAFVNIQESDGQTEVGRFINVRSAMENEETRKVVLAAAIAEAKRFSAKYAQYKELAEIFEAIETVSERIKAS